LGSIWENDLQVAVVLFIAAVCSVWMPSVALGKQWRLPLWVPVFVGSIAAASVAGLLDGRALIALAVLLAFGCLAVRPGADRTQRAAFSLLSFVLCFVLALHALPGFHNAVLISGAHFSVDSAPFTQYANFDKGAAGLVLLALLSKRAQTAQDWRMLCLKAAPIAILGSVVVLALATAIGFVRLDFKLPSYTPVFLAINLFFACLAEEAFFRGFIQERLARLLKKRAWGTWLAIFVSALLFGLVHMGGGWRYVMLASCAGLFYAWAYHATRKVEAAILAHFLLNAAHFVLFTYPSLA
jgi:membrane protease YdiL (CAAX protease family)